MPDKGAITGLSNNRILAFNGGGKGYPMKRL